MRGRIVGTGHYLPQQVRTNHDLEQFMDTTDAWIRQRTGIGQRHLAAPEEATSDLATQACRAAMADAGLGPDDIDLLICCTTTPDHLFPATACLVQHQLGLPRAGAYDVNAACSGFIYGIATANAFIQAGVYRTVLVVGAEKVTNRLNWSQRETAVLFGDGAGAVILQATDGEFGILNTFLASDGGEADLLMLPGGGSRTPPTPENIGAPVHDFQMKGPELFKRAVGAFGQAIQRALDTGGITVDALDLLVPHQANARIIKAAARRLAIPDEKVFLNIEHVANTTAASIPIALDEARRVGAIREGSMVVLASFGAGLTWASALLRW